MLLWTWGCRYLFELVFSFSSDQYQEVELLDNMVVLFLTFWGTSTLFSIVAAPLYIPTSSAQGFPFHTLTDTCYLLSFWWWSSWQVWSDSLLWFWFAFLWWLVMLSIFSCTCCPSVCLFQKNVYSDPLPIFKK